MKQLESFTDFFRKGTDNSPKVFSQFKKVLPRILSLNNHPLFLKMGISIKIVNGPDIPYFSRTDLDERLYFTVSYEGEPDAVENFSLIKIGSSYRFEYSLNRKSHTIQMSEEDIEISIVNQITRRSEFVNKQISSIEKMRSEQEKEIDDQIKKNKERLKKIDQSIIDKRAEIKEMKDKFSSEFTPQFFYR